MGPRSTSSTLGPKASVIVLAAILVSTLGMVLFPGSGGMSASTAVIGMDRVVAWEPLPASMIDGDTCEFVLASSSTPPGLATAIPRETRSSAASAQASAGPGDAIRAEVGQRKPLRIVTDPDYGFSGVAVDPVRNEVILTDQNKSHIVIFDRLEHTPVDAPRSQPKRVIGGEESFLEYASSVYVDPANGDLYMINNDTMNWMPVFGHGAEGNVRPKRVLATPQASIGIAAHEASHEIFVTDQDDHAVLIFDKDARTENADPNTRVGRRVQIGGTDASADSSTPKRILQGPRTGLADPHGVAVDPRRDELFVSNWGTSNLRPTLEAASYGPEDRRGYPVSRMHAVAGSGKIEPPSITVYPRDARSDTVPVRTIRGPKTQLNWPTALAVHPERGELFVANDPTDSVLVFRIDADGDVAPIRVLKGARSLLKNPTGVAVDTTNNELWVANFGNHSATVYPIDATGDAAPLRVIRSAPIASPAPMLSNAHSMVFDSNRDEILVANCVGHPSISAFSRTADGSVSPVRSIGGQRTLISRTIHDMAYDPIHDEIIVPAWYVFGISTFRGGDNGDVAPVRVIYGPKTQLKNAEAVAVDPVHGEIFVPSSAVNTTANTRDRVLVFRRQDNGDVAPIRILEGPDTGLSMGRVTVDPVHDLLIASGRDGIRIFDRTASGNTKPKAFIKGGGGLMTTYPPKGLIFVAQSGGGRYVAEDYVAVWSINDSGDVPPLWEIGRGIFYDIRGVTIDPKTKTVMATDKKLNAILTFHVPEIFDASDSVQESR